MKARQNKTPRYTDLRARLMQRGYTLASFARTFGYKVPTTYCAARGTRVGVESLRIASHLKRIAYAQEK